MGWITDNFGTYQAYRTWSKKQRYGYHYKITYGASSEILTINPGGTTEGGIKVEESKIYLGRFYSLNLGLRFFYKSGAGGDILRDSLYLVDGTKAECTVEIVKLNKTTKDFDPYFTGIADFTTYREEVDEQGLRIITVDLLEQSDIQKFLARENIELDITSNTSVNGTTIIDVTPQSNTFTPVNYYREASTDSGTIIRNTGFTSSQTVYSYFTGGTEIIDTTGGRFDFDPTNGKIYENDLGESITMKVALNIPYEVEINIGTGSSITVTYQLVVYNSGGTPLQTENLKVISNTYTGIQVHTGTLTNTFDYTDITVPDGGYMVFQAKIVATKGAGVAILQMEFTGTRLAEFWEKSSSIGSTDATCYQVWMAFLKLMRLMLDRNDVLESDFLTDSANLVYDEYITSVRNLRAFPTSWVKLSFRELFEHVRSIWQIALDYDRTNNRFKIVPDNEIYSGTARLDLGTIKNLKFSPTEYYSEVEAGYNQDGELEALQGVQMSHLKVNYSMDFTEDNKMDLRGGFIMSAYEMEYYRRQQYSSTGQTDTKKDDKICYVYAPSNQTNTASTLTGWEGIEETYNQYTTPRQNILRNRFIKGYYNYGAGTIRFVSNKKNVEYYYGATLEQSDISSASLTPAVCLPEQIEGEVTFTPVVKDAIDSNIYGVWTVTDEAGQEYEVHLTSVVFKDAEEKVTITAKLDN